MIDLPNIDDVATSTARLLTELGLDLIPTRSWSSPLPLKTCVRLTGQLTVGGERLRTARFHEVIKKLSEHHIYLQFYSGNAVPGNYHSPLSCEDQSPGMDAKVRASYHPGGYFEERAIVRQTPISEIPPVVTPVREVITVVKPVSGKPLSKPPLPNLSTITIENLRKISNLFHSVLPEIDAILAASEISEAEVYLEAKIDPNIIRRPLDGLSKLFDDADEDSEEES